MPTPSRIKRMRRNVGSTATFKYSDETRKVVVKNVKFAKGTRNYVPLREGGFPAQARAGAHLVGLFAAWGRTYPRSDQDTLVSGKPLLFRKLRLLHADGVTRNRWTNRLP